MCRPEALEHKCILLRRRWQQHAAGKRRRCSHCLPVLRSRHEQFCQQKNAKCLLCFGDERPEQTAC
jgi:hypothetical protein